MKGVKLCFHDRIDNCYTTLPLCGPFLWIWLNCLKAIQPLREGSLPLTIKTSGDPDFYLIDLVNFGVTTVLTLWLLARESSVLITRS